VGERFLSLKEAAKRLPGRPHIGTLYRWIVKGAIEATKIGGRWFVSESALHRFIEATPSAPRDGHVAKPRPTKAERQRDVAAAERQLRDAGVLRDDPQL